MPFQTHEERERISPQESGPVRSNPSGPRSGYSVVPFDDSCTSYRRDGNCFNEAYSSNPYWLLKHAEIIQFHGIQAIKQPFSNHVIQNWPFEVNS